MEAHGGRIWAESDGPGLGARFTFTIPVAEGEGTGGAGTPAPPSVRSRRGSREQARILAVDDDPQALRYVRDALAKAGYSPIVTGDPQDVPRLMEEEKPASGPVGPDAAGERRDRPDEGHPGDGGRAGHLPFGVRPGGGDRQGLRHGGRRLRGQALLAHGAGGEDQGGPAQAGLARNGPSPPGPYSLGDLSIDYAERRVTLAGRPVQVTATEYELLYRLSAAAGRVLTHDQLLQAVWGPERAGEPWLVRNVVKRLRRKLLRRRRQPHLRLHGTPRRLPDGEGGDAGAGGSVKGRLTPLPSLGGFTPIELVLKYLDRQAGDGPKPVMPLSGIVSETGRC